jgi:hypothetical protein
MDCCASSPFRHHHTSWKERALKILGRRNFLNWKVKSTELSQLVAVRHINKDIIQWRETRSSRL